MHACAGSCRSPNELNYAKLYRGLHVSHKNVTHGLRQVPARRLLSICMNAHKRKND
jgi:hypothetical protein